MRILSVYLALVLSSCQTMPEIAKSVQEIATNDAITVQVDKDAIQRDVDVDVVVNVKHKE